MLLTVLAVGRITDGFTDGVDNYQGSPVIKGHVLLQTRPLLRVNFVTERCDPPEAAFFRDAMRLVRNQQDEDDPIPITYDSLCAVFKKHIQLAKGPQASSVLSE